MTPARHEHPARELHAGNASARGVQPPRLRTDHVLGYAVHPAFLEIRNLLDVLLGDVSMLGDDLRNARLTSDDRTPTATQRRLERTGLGLTRHLLALEATLLAADEPALLDEAIEAADAVARHVTRAAGGVRWRRAETHAIVAGARSASVVGIAAALRLLAEALPPGSARGIDATVRLDRCSAELTLVAPDATPAVYRAAGAQLRACSPRDGSFSVTTGERGLTMAWRRSPGRAGL